MGFVFILLAVLILLGGGTYYGYQAGYYNFRRFSGGLIAIVFVLFIFFLLARPS